MDILKIAVLAVAGVLLSKLSTALSYIGQLEALVDIEGVYLDTILKMLGISYITQFASDLCKDAGYSAVASQIELFARISILFLSFPVLMALVQTIEEVL